ncbi:MAG: hypothetical protein KIT19_12245 [Phycisphaeraceae bacterium]|nr:hypothetical protein [Phycisphaeraceae bacterium]
MRARVTLRGLVPLESDGTDVVGIGVVPWAAIEPVYGAAGPAHDRFVWIDERGRVVRRRELGGRAVFEVAPATAMGKKRKREGKRLATPRRAWMRAVKCAARDGSLVVVRDQRAAWWLEVVIWCVAMAAGVAVAVWWFRAQVAPLLGSRDAASVALVAIMGVVCVCWPGLVLMLMWPRRDVIRGRVARWSRIDASGIRAGWSPEHAEHFSWEELADASVYGLRPHRIVTSAGREVMLSVSARGLEWINQMIWEPRVAAMEEEAAEWEEEGLSRESGSEEGESAESRGERSEETLGAMAAERRGFERSWRWRAAIGCVALGVVTGILLALTTHSSREGSWAWTMGAGAIGFAMGSLLLPFLFGVFWVMGSIGDRMSAWKGRGIAMIRARITLAGLAPVDPAGAGGIGTVPWTELWRGSRGYEWRDAERRWVRLGTARERVAFTLDRMSERTHDFEESGCYERLLRRAARQGRLRVVVDQCGIWCAETFVLGMEVMVPTLCAAAMVATFFGPLESWGAVGWLIVGAVAVGAAGLTARDWRELWRTPVRVRADSTGLVLRMITVRTRRVVWGDVQDVRRAGDMRITTSCGHPFCMVLSPRMDALLDAHVRSRVRLEPERDPFNARNVLRAAMLMGVLVGVIGIYAMVSNGKPIFPGAVHAGMILGGMVLTICGLMLGAQRLKPHVI